MPCVPSLVLWYCAPDSSLVMSGSHPPVCQIDHKFDSLLVAWKATLTSSSSVVHEIRQRHLFHLHAQ